jgi:hypothetical protein
VLIERGPGSLVLTVYHPTRRWFGRKQSRWALEWQQPVLEEPGVRTVREIKGGWTQPTYGVQTFRAESFLTDWYPE